MQDEKKGKIVIETSGRSVTKVEMTGDIDSEAIIAIRTELGVQWGTYLHELREANLLKRKVSQVDAETKRSKDSVVEAERVAKQKAAAQKVKVEEAAKQKEESDKILAKREEAGSTK